MKIIKNSVVALKYEVFDERGGLVERGSEPLVYLHGGYGGLFPKLEDALAGKEAGERLRVTLPPDDAFGPQDPALVRTEPRSRFKGKVKVGMRFQGELQHDDHAHPVTFRIVKVTPDEVTLDGNPPLAGQTIEFRCTVLDVRPASPEEVAHGHAHGPGDHHH